jgi:hypothetical protein
MILEWEERAKKRGPDPKASYAWEVPNMPLEDTPVYEHHKSILDVKANSSICDFCTLIWRVWGVHGGPWWNHERKEDLIKEFHKKPLFLRICGFQSNPLNAKESSPSDNKPRLYVSDISYSENIERWADPEVSRPGRPDINRYMQYPVPEPSDLDLEVYLSVEGRLHGLKFRSYSSMLCLVVLS